MTAPRIEIDGPHTRRKTPAHWRWALVTACVLTALLVTGVLP